MVSFLWLFKNVIVAKILFNRIPPKNTIQCLNITKISKTYRSISAALDSNRSQQFTLSNWARDNGDPTCGTDLKKAIILCRKIPSIERNRPVNSKKFKNELKSTLVLPYTRNSVAGLTQIRENTSCIWVKCGNVFVSERVRATIILGMRRRECDCGEFITTDGQFAFGSSGEHLKFNEPLSNEFIVDKRTKC